MIVLYPGSFDPPTLGHMDIIGRAAGLFEKVYVAVMVNRNKAGLFPYGERLEMLRACVGAYENVEALLDDGLLYELAGRLGAGAVLRGLRDAADYQAEARAADAIYSLSGVETVFLKTDPRRGFISSSMVRELLSFGGAIDDLVPAPVLKMVNGPFNKGGC